MSSSANIWVPILVALVTGLVTVITVFLTGRANLKLEREKFTANARLERQKFESTLILQAIATGNREIAQKNLEFMVTAGFLPDPGNKIKELVERPADIPVLPARRGARQPKFQRPVYRWGVRTGSDPDAHLIKDSPVHTTIEALASKPRPKGMETGTEIGDDRRSSEVERTIYELEAMIISYKVQMSGSYTFILQGETGQTIIANCVDPQFVPPGSRWAKEIAATRNEVVAKLTPGPNYTHVNHRVRVTGIGFFNQIHGQTGAARNSLELTPVLGIQWL